MNKTLNNNRIALDKTVNTCYNTGMRNKMTNNNNNIKKVNTMSNLDKLINHFMLRGHSRLNAVKLAKSTLAIIDSDGGDNTPPFDNFHPLNATKISPRWADGSKRKV